MARRLGWLRNSFTDVERPDPRSDVGDAVVVPMRPGALVRMRDLEHSRDEIDDVLDDVFGTPDDRGPGIADAVLLAGGLGAVVVGQAGSAGTGVTLAGVAAVALGAVLPIRSGWRRIRSARRSRRLASFLGDGKLLRVDSRLVAQLLEAHEGVLGAASGLATTERASAHEVAHSAVLEVASVLDGRLPIGPKETEYVSARIDALNLLKSAIVDPRTGDGEARKRQSLVEAREEVERLAGGSSLTDAAELARQLLGDSAN